MQYTAEELNKLPNEELMKIKEKLLAENKQLESQQKVGGFLGNVGNSFLGGLRGDWKEKPDTDLDTYYKKAMIKQSMTPGGATGEAEEVPPGYASYGGKLYKLPSTTEGGVKTVKEQAFDAISKNETLPGLSVEETKKVAGVYIPPKKPSAAEEKRTVEEGKLGDELGGLLSSFDRATKEASSVPGFGAPGVMGRLAGKGASVSGKFGYLPATNVYNAQRKAFATVVAKAAGEVRPTDEDIRRFVQTLPDIEKSDAENSLLISDIQDKVSKGNIGELWGKAKSAPVPSFATEEEAEASGHKGEVSIAGRRARIE